MPEHTIEERLKKLREGGTAVAEPPTTPVEAPVTEGTTLEQRLDAMRQAPVIPIETPSVETTLEERLKALPQEPSAKQPSGGLLSRLTSPIINVPGVSGPINRVTGAILPFIQRNITEPAGAAATVIEAPSVLGLAGVPGFQEEFAFNPEQLPGQPEFRERFRENIPLGSRILAEAGADPLNLIPGVGLTRLPTRASQIGRVTGSINITERGAVAARRARIGPGPLEIPPEVFQAQRVQAEALEQGLGEAFPNTTGVLRPMAEDVESIVTRLTGMIEEARPRQKQIIRLGEEARTEERRLRVGAASAVERTLRAQGVSAREANRRSTALLKDPLPVPAFEPLQIADNEVAPLFEHISNMNLQYFGETNIRVALEKVLAGIRPSPSETAGLQAIFGRSFANAIRAKRSFAIRAGEQVLDVLNAPRQIMTAYDVSAPLRQGIVLAPGHPGRFAESFVTMFKALASEGAAETVEVGIRNDPDFIRFAARHRPGDPKNLFIADLTRGARGMSGQEEQWMSALANKIPGIRQSQRAYVTFLNKFRWDVMKDIVAKWERKATQIERELVEQGLPQAEINRRMEGIRVTNNDLDELALFLNRATGRGSLGKLNKFAPAINTIAFAPKLLASRIQLPMSLVGTSAKVRGQAAKDLVWFTGTGTAVLSALSLLPGVTVELDPRSPDFGKIKSGNTTIDFWGGFQPIARYGAQLASGQRKTISGKKIGEISSVPRFDLGTWQDPVFLRFVRSKLSPAASFGADITIGGGEDFLGRPIFGDPEDTRNERLSDAGRNALQRIAPLFWQDLLDAYRVEGTTGLFKALPGGFGAGITTFERNP